MFFTATLSLFIVAVVALGCCGQRRQQRYVGRSLRVIGGSTSHKTIGLIIVWRRMPELTGRSLEQIEGQLHRGRFRPRDFKHDKAEPAAASTTDPA